MACVGTLSWSVAGLGGWMEPQRRGAVPGPDPGKGADTKPAVARQAYAGEASGPAGEKRGAAQNAASGEAARAGAATRHGEAARTMRGEVGPLEVDWCQTVQRCMDGDSGAWAEL